MYSPLALWTVMSVAAIQENRWELLLAGVVMAWPVAVTALWRVPQELRRSRARSWELDEAGETFLWKDPSIEWGYARWQSSALVVWLRRLMALGVPAATVLAVIESNGWVMLWLPIAVSLIVYTYRHLPTPLVRMRRFRRCWNCDAPDRSAGAARVCPRCNRVTDVVTLAAVPALRRRWRAM